MSIERVCRTCALYDAASRYCRKRAEDQIDTMYEGFPDPGYCVRKDYDHFIRKH